MLSKIDLVAEAQRANGQYLTLPRPAMLGLVAELASDGMGRARDYRALNWLRERGWLARAQTERGSYTYARCQAIAGGTL